MASLNNSIQGNSTKMKLKTLLLFVAATLAGTLRAQTEQTLTVDCGKDIVLCPGDSYAFITAYPLDGEVNNENFDTLFIGQNVRVTGGTEPYTYTWSCDTQTWYDGRFPQNATNFLNNITSANPYIIYTPYNQVTVFRLQVADAKGNVAIDSLTLFQESFTCIMEYPMMLPKENPVYIDGYLGMYGCFPIYYSAVYKDDTINLPTRIEFLPSDSITICAIDSVGCYIKPVTLYAKDFLITSVDEELSDHDVVKLIDNTLVFNNNREKQIRIYSAVGQLLYSGSTANSIFKLPPLKNAGHCICSVIIDKKISSLHLYYK